METDGSYFVRKSPEISQKFADDKEKFNEIPRWSKLVSV